MASNNYRVYLDGNEFFDIPKGVTDFVTSIIRMDGFDNTEQILIDSAETMFEFWGDGFNYICQKRKENICEEILYTIELECDEVSHVLFEGLIKQSKIEVQLKKCIARCTNLKDNSFGGLLRDFINVEVELFSTKTKNCFPLSLPVILINTPTTPNTYSITDVTTFDCLDVLKYIIAYFTDNRVTVKSDYLTTTKIAITTGFNLHNTTGNLNKVYPSISFEKVFTELRKKETLYMAVEYEPDGTPYLRIEDENYFYADELLFEIPEIPLDAVERIDEKRLFNVIEVGSNTVEAQEGTTLIKPQNRLTAWNKESYIGCGGCSGEKDSKLDLVSDFIIDPNLIHEAMNAAEGADYENDDKIYLLNYYNAGIGTIAWRLVGNNLSNYNERFNNENVLQRWVGISNSCISVSRFTKYGFRATNPANEVITIESGSGDIIAPTNCDFIRIQGTHTGPMISQLLCNDELFDNENSIENINPVFDTSTFNTFGLTKFECVENGNYVFHAKSKLKCIQNAPEDYVFPLAIEYAVRFVVYSDDTFTTEIDASDVTDIVNSTPSTQIDNFDITSPTFALVVGNVVVVEIEVKSINIIGTGFYYLTAIYDSLFELISDNASCEDITDDTGLFKPFVTTFKYAPCIEQYMSVKNNKSGYILFAGIKTWVKEFPFSNGKVSTISLIHKESYCGCN